VTGERFRAALARFGSMPLPPYIKRAGGGDSRDRDDYQTIFAAQEGAVAAPTAGLHFTPRLLAALDAAGIERATVTLHVGAGTFLPVKAEDTRDHKMHSEWGFIAAETAERINVVRTRGGRIVAIGTTSLRLLESAAAADGRLRPFAGETSLFITPGYRFRAIDLLLTNFHLPRSTLFMLVAAFAGLERMKRAYAHAIAAQYRFFSYGDATLLYPER
jgi:S-adenosylmethionine:tRNA ribosyltransferase-isomerase